MTNEHAQWLRDFAAANKGNFDPDQIWRLKDAATEIEDLIQERDEARVGCALAWAKDEFVPSGWDEFVPSDRDIEDAAIKIAQENGWNCFPYFNKAKD